MAILVFESAGAQQPSSGAPVCQLRELSRKQLRTTAGHVIYVEPTSVQQSGDQLLIAGYPNYLHPANAGPGIVAFDSIFGAIIDRSGAVSVVLPPVPGRLLSVRAAARIAGGWHVLFAEVEPDTGRPGPQRDVVRQLWYGVLQLKGWSEVLRLPMPADKSVDSFNSSKLLVAGDSLFWATKVASAIDKGFIAWQRYGGVWRISEADAGIVSRVEAYWLPQRGPAVLALTARPQAFGDDLMRGRTDLKLWSPNPSWSVIETVVGHEDHFEMVLHRSESSAGPVYSMITHVGGMPPRRVEARVVIDNTAPTGPKWHILSDHAELLIPIGSPTMPPTWLLTDGGPAADTGVIRVLQLTQGGTIAASTLQNPYKGNFNAFWDGESTLTLVGGVLEPQAAIAPLYGLVYRVQVDCTARY